VRERVQVEAVVARMLQAVAPTAERQRIQVLDRAEPHLPAVLGHADQLEQVMLNLFMNAIEAMPQGGRLEVATRARDSGIEVIVSDTGSGVPAALRDRIFEPFFTDKSGGTGLGLYLSRQLVEAHGGRLELIAGEGGARFRILLPAAGKETGKGGAA
jgi:two-component system sensor histidine kinase AtoS